MTISNPKKSFKKMLLPVILIAVLVAGTTAAVSASNLFSLKEDTIYQISTYDALSKGSLDGITTLKDATKHSNFGIGTFVGLDGEMVFVDGKMYQIKSDGKAYLKDESQMNKELTPYIVSTSFETDISEQLGDSANYPDLQTIISSKITNKDLFYAIRIDGTFNSIKVRSVPKQEKPYPILADALKNQTVFDYSNIKGTLVGYWCPSYVGGVNVPGFHLHFITEDRKLGGHVLEVAVKEGELKIDKSSAFSMILPDNN